MGEKSKEKSQTAKKFNTAGFSPRLQSDIDSAHNRIMEETDPSYNCFILSYN